jgi:hypothetical protein
MLSGNDRSVRQKRAQPRNAIATESSKARNGSVTPSLASMVARREQLNRLESSLAKEMMSIRKGIDPMLSMERKAYTGALHAARGGIKDVRVFRFLRARIVT